MSVARDLRDAVFRRHPWRIHFFNETLTARDARIALATLASPRTLATGAQLAAYERAFAEAIDPTGRAFSFAAARMGLYAIVKAADLQPGDEVILPPFTCEVVVLAVQDLGLSPVYADIDLATLNVTPASVARVVTPRTRAVVAQHTFGAACDVDGIRAAAPGALVIEDCALALGSRSADGRPLGSLGDAAIFSTDRTKTISTVSGGVAYTRDPALADRVARVQQESVTPSRRSAAGLALQVAASAALHARGAYPIGRDLMALAYKSGLFRSPPACAREAAAGEYPVRFANVQAKVGLHQLGMLPRLLDERRAMVAAYKEELRRAGVATPGVEADHVLRFPILLRDRDAFVRKHHKYVEVGTWFDAPAIGWRGDPAATGYVPGSCPQAELAHRHIVNLPTLVRSRAHRQYLFNSLRDLRPEDGVDDPGQALEGVADGRREGGRHGSPRRGLPGNG